MKKTIKNLLNKLPYIKGLHNDVLKYKKGYPPGHYYSPVVSTEEIKENENKIFSIQNDKLPGIRLNEEKQMLLLNEFLTLYPSVPFSPEKSKYRYYFNNDAYAYSDGIMLNLMMRHFKPKRIIEIGSGYSSVNMLDTNELFFENSIHLTFIEPYPERFLSLCNTGDEKLYSLISKNLQDVDSSIFGRLDEGNFLFVDSTHVSKTGSDVNTILFEIMPFLKKGVFIHFHDIFYPFEYPKEWVLGWSGFGWNEIYLLHAFLLHNDDYEIILFNTFLEHFHEDWFIKNMPECLKNKGGSLWLRKIK